MNPRRILVTGATGLIGTAITAAFSKEPFLVKAISRNEHKKFCNIEWITADCLDRKTKWQKYLEGIDILVHNAACLFPGNTEADRALLMEVNVEFTKSICEYAGKAGVKKVIFTSSFSLLAKPLPEIITENTPVSATSAYPLSKLLGEQLVQDSSAKYGFSYNILRVSSPVSSNLSHMPSTVIKKWINTSLKGHVLQIHGQGSRAQDFVAVTDVAKAYVNCITKPESSGIFNIASGNSVTMFELAKLITERFGNRYEFVGKDLNEGELWNISIEKAQKGLNYSPTYNSRTSVVNLLKNTPQ